MEDSTTTMMMIVFLLAFLIFLFLIFFTGEQKELGFLVSVSIKVSIALIILGICGWVFFHGEMAPFLIVGVFILMSALTSSFVAILYTTFFADTTNLVTKSTSQIANVAGIAKSNIAPSSNAVEKFNSGANVAPSGNAYDAGAATTPGETTSTSAAPTDDATKKDDAKPATTTDLSFNVKDTVNTLKDSAKSYFKFGSSEDEGAGADFWNDRSDQPIDMEFFMQMLVFTVAFFLIFCIGISKIFINNSNKQ